MDTTITIAVLGASISVAGWIANYILSTSSERHRQRLLTQIEFTKQQLEELYGPLVFLVMEGQYSFSEAEKTITSPTNHNESSEPFFTNTHIPRIIETGISEKPEQDDDVWKYWIENEFFPRNEKIKSLLAHKTHLIEGDQMPQSWLDFIEHYNSWRINFDRWEKNLAKYPHYSRTGWPRDFDDDILSTFKLLKKRQSYLMGIIEGRKNRKTSY